MTSEPRGTRSTPELSPSSEDCPHRVTMVVRDRDRTLTFYVCDRHIAWADQQLDGKIVVHVPQRKGEIGSACMGPKGSR